MEDIVLRSEKLAKKCAEKIGLEIVEVSYVKESGNKILRIIATSEDGLDIDKATELNQMISDELDVLDFINEEYFLEVSSPGLERELKNDNDISKAVGKYICIKTYEKIENMNEIYGDLISYDGNKFVLSVNIKGRKKVIQIDKNKVCKTRMAVKF